MIFKESIGEIIRLGDELVSIDDVSVNGKLASDCEEAVKRAQDSLLYLSGQELDVSSLRGR